MFKSLTAHGVAALTVTLMSQNSAFAQTNVTSQLPVITSAIVTASSSTELAQSGALTPQLIEVDRYTVKPASKAKWTGDIELARTPDETRWLLVPEPNTTKTAKPVRNYAKEFSGLRPTLLPNNAAKIGTATQYKESDEAPAFKTDKSSQTIYSQNLHSKAEDNFLLRATLGF